MDEESEFNYVQTCGLCEIICNLNDVATHDCLRGYSHYTTDENLYFYPLLDDGVTIVRRSLIQSSEVTATVPLQSNNIENIQPTSNTGQRKEKLSLEEEETLILEVQCRQPLWNFRLPLAQRNNKITKHLWQEVSNAINGKLSAIGCKNKFKNLHDTYRRLINSEKLPSGSASKSNIYKWRHAKIMEFLRDSCLQKRTISNINDEEINNNDVHESNNEANENSSVSGGSYSRKKKTTSDSYNSHMERLTEILKQPSSNIILSSPPEEDHIDAFLKLFGYNLRKLTPEKQDKWIERYLQQSYEMLKTDL